MLEEDVGYQPSVAQVLDLLRRRRRLVLAWCALCTATVLAVVLLRGPSYTARTSFIPQSRRNASLAAGVAAQLGFALPGQDQTQSPNFYSDLASSDLVLGAIADSGAADASHRRVSLAQFFDVSEDRPAVTRARVIALLRSRLSANVVQKTGLVELGMKTRDPAVSASLLQQILTELERFNQGARRSQAAAERRFTERRFDEVRGELNAAEQRLVSFLERNRDFENSPLLRFENDRLQRDVQLKQQVFQTLSQAVEQARIDEVRDTPVLTVIEPPSPPPVRDRRGLLLKLGGALAFAIATASVIAVLAVLRADERARTRTLRSDERPRTRTLA
jgi:uncharacterized protein involved in exopolysaccharide biosynthesis